MYLVDYNRNKGFTLLKNLKKVQRFLKLDDKEYYRMYRSINKKDPHGNKKGWYAGKTFRVHIKIPDEELINRPFERVKIF